MLAQGLYANVVLLFMHQKGRTKFFVQPYVIKGLYMINILRIGWQEECLEEVKVVCLIS